MVSQEAFALIPIVNPSSLPRRLSFAALLFLGVLPSTIAVAQVALLPQEQAIADYMATTPGQGRAQLVLDPVIEGVARARAQDMAVRNYFNHVNPDGVAANYLLRQAGYVLPAWWGTDPAANYVESIAAGYPDAASTWNAWMNSPDHKAHLLAQNSFYASETHYGVGYYYDSNSTYKYYWVVITAPPQPLQITTPVHDVKVTSSSIPVAGISDPGTSPATVEFRVENVSGTGAYQVATGTTNWSGTATGLVSGANVIRAQSLDSSGNLIAEVGCKVIYGEPGTLTVTESGSGSVTSAYMGVTTQTVGQVISLKATPAPGCLFAGWTGSITSGSAVLNFAMKDGLDLQANFVPNPFAPLVGAYFGILTSGSGVQSGLVRLTLAGNGMFTGRALLPGKSLPFEGRLNTSGSDTITIPHSGNPPLVIDLQADLSGSGGGIAGTVSGGTEFYALTLSQSTYNTATHAAPQAGRYTVVLEPNPASHRHVRTSRERLWGPGSGSQWSRDYCGPAWGRDALRYNGACCQRWNPRDLLRAFRGTGRVEL